MSPGLLAAKLRHPLLPARRLHRRHLVRRLDRGLELGRQLTLVSAPAGFGKTTCIAEWAGGLDRPVGWLSLDAADDDPGRFFAYLVGALQKVDPALGHEIGAVLRAGQLPPAAVIATTLSNDLLAWEGRSVLVLDDFHWIQDRLILEVLEQLLGSLPPALHLVLITREDPSLPLARLRAHNRMTEIRAGDLRFSSDEADRFLDGVMGLSLSPADVAALDSKTEGWVVGLQLAAIALQALPLGQGMDPSAFIAALSGSHRFILSYLTQEVLDRQPEEVCEFLLQTAILDRLSGDLCDAVTGRHDGRLMLERLLEANLFVIPLDDRREWYRYHHLFADLLRDRQQALYPGQTAELHRRASAWYAWAGAGPEAGIGIGPHGAVEAVQHALAARDYERAVDLVEDRAVGMIMQAYVKTVAGWMQAIPPEYSASSPRANMAFAWMHFVRGTMGQAAPYVQRLREIFSAPPPHAENEPALHAQWLALQATMHNAQRNPHQALALAGRALDIVPAGDHYVQGLIHLGLADAYQQLDEYDHAAQAFQKIVYHGRAAANLVVETMGTAGLAAMAIRGGRLQRAFDIASRGLDRIERSGSLPPISAALYGTLGHVHYHRNDVEEARRDYARATQVSALSGYHDAGISHEVILSRLCETAGDLEAAGRHIQRANDLLQEGAAPWVRPEVLAQQVRVHLAADRPAAAEAVLYDSGVSPQDEVTYITDAVHLAYLRLLRYRGERQGQRAELARAARLARRIVEAARAGQRLETALQGLILGSLVQAAAGDAAAGLALLEQALELAGPEGYARVFVEEGAPLVPLLRRTHQPSRFPGHPGTGWAAHLLAHLPPTTAAACPPSAPAPWVEPLSERELEILHLIHEGCSNAEIARRLVITLYTVKKHNSNIYGKLAVKSRTQALARARELGLL